MKIIFSKAYVCFLYVIMQKFFKTPIPVLYMYVIIKHNLLLFFVFLSDHQNIALVVCLLKIYIIIKATLF